MKMVNSNIDRIIEEPVDYAEILNHDLFHCKFKHIMTNKDEFDIIDITFGNNLPKISKDIKKFVDIIHNDMEDADVLIKSMVKIRKVFKVRKATWYEITIRAIIEQRKAIMT
jgi:hypothetical protein